jgi:hypothetical protein
MHPHSCFSYALTSPSSLFAREPSAAFQTPATVCRDGVLPLVLPPPHTERSLEAEAVHCVAIIGVRWEDVTWGRSTHQHAASDFIYFASYALSRLMLPFYALLFTLLEHYGPQHQHLSLHSIMLVVIFVHLYEMYVTP